MNKYNTKDCWELVRLYYLDRGYTLPERPNGEVYGYFDEIPEPIEHALLAFALESDNVDHVGVCVGRNRFIHATETLGVVIHPISYYHRFLKGVYLINDNANKDKKPI